MGVNRPRLYECDCVMIHETNAIVFLSMLSREKIGHCSLEARIVDTFRVEP